MKYSIDTTKKFNKALKKCIKRGLNFEHFKECIYLLSSTGTLPAKYRPHKLVGKYAGAWECHIEPDWLLIYKQAGAELQLYRTGTHSDLFGK